MEHFFLRNNSIEFDKKKIINKYKLDLIQNEREKATENIRRCLIK